MRNFKSVFYQIRKKIWPKSIVLCYHRVGDTKYDPSNITVSRKNFESHIHWLKDEFHMLTADELKHAIQNNRTYVQREHSREKFSIEMDKFIDKALLNEYSK